MLNFLIDAITPLVMLSVLFGLLVAYCGRQAFKLPKWLLLAETVLALVGGITIYVMRRLNPKGLVKPLAIFNRWTLAVTLIALLLMLLALVMTFICHSRQRMRYAAAIATVLWGGIAAIAMAAISLPSLFQLTHEFVAFGEDKLSTASLFRTGGYILGILLCLMIGLSLCKVLKRLSPRGFNFFSFLFALSLIFEYTLKGVAALGRLRILPRRGLVFDLMIFEDVSQPWTVGAYVFVMLLAALTVFVTHLRIKKTYSTPAQRRKALWWLRNCRRWSVASVVFILLGFLAVTVLYQYVTKPVELAPAQPYQDHGRQIIIPLTDVEDGHLHRFAYDYQGHHIRFIVVKKPQGNTYGVGLDACDICGVAGYYERKNDVICKRCDVVMNKSTIGFKGGCNPVPFEYVIEDGQIIIDKAVLEAEKDRFPEGQ